MSLHDTVERARIDENYTKEAVQISNIYDPEEIRRVTERISAIISDLSEDEKGGRR